MKGQWTRTEHDIDADNRQPGAGLAGGPVDHRRRHPPHRASRPVDLTRSGQIRGPGAAGRGDRRAEHLGLRRCHRRWRRHVCGGRPRRQQAPRSELRQHELRRHPTGGVRHPRTRDAHGPARYLGPDHLPQHVRLRRAEVRRAAGRGAAAPHGADLQRRLRRDAIRHEQPTLRHGDPPVVGRQGVGRRDTPLPRDGHAGRELRHRTARHRTTRPRPAALGPAVGRVRRTINARELPHRREHRHHVVVRIVTLAVA
ncbi:unannotated protein [freshwater metagenome]|uniref:Unannotated protein n=1 Tax=freshwater metagenome TaxID=449393 RepID=A0A6J7AVI8_9ZZZZ